MKITGFYHVVIVPALSLSVSLSHRYACAELMLGSRLWPTYLQLIPHVTDFRDPS